MKIAYAGFDLFYNAIQALIDNGCTVAKIFSCKADNVSEFNKKITALAKEKSIPITYDRITRDDLIDLKAQGVQALFCAGYYYLIPIVDDMIMLNIHPSLLPMGRGAWPMPVAILNGDQKSGVTIHKMDKSFDTGDIVMQEEFSLSDSDNLDTFMQKANSTVSDMICRLLSDFDSYYNNAKKQGKGEYLEEPNISDYIITKDTSFCDADRILRAFYGFPVIYYDGKNEHKLIRAKAAKGTADTPMLKILGGYITEGEI